MTTFAIHTPDRDRPAIENSFAASLQNVWWRHAYIVPSFAIALLVCSWYVSWGEWNFFERETFCGFYDAQARSILHGRLDVPPAAIGFEAFVFRGKSYGYFGIAPAILRMPLVVLFKSMDGRWSRLFMLAGFFVNLLCAYWLVLWVRGPDRILTRIDRVLNSLFVLCGGLGSTSIFIVGRSYTYHEAIMLGGVFALLFAVALVKYLATPSLRRLALLGLFAFMSFHSRPTGGAGALLALCVLAAILVVRSWHFVILRYSEGSSRYGKLAGSFGVPQDDVSRVRAQDCLGFQPIANPLPHATIAILSIIVILGVYFGVNYGKFRTFDGVPVKYYSIYHLNPSRMAVTGGRQIHPENIPMGLACYFGFRGAEFKPDFPWIFLCRTPSMIGKPALDIVEQFSSIPVSMPALGLLALLGCMQIVRGETERQRQMRLPIIALMLGGGIILMTVGITERYLHDLYPFLIAAGAVGVMRVSRGRSPALAPSPLYSGERAGGDASSCSIPGATLAIAGSRIWECRSEPGRVGPVGPKVRHGDEPTARPGRHGPALKLYSHCDKVAPFHERPLTPALSPEPGGEGVNTVATTARMRAKISVLIVLALVSIILNCTFSIEYQRMAVWGVSQSRHDGFYHFRQSVQNLWHGRPIPTNEE